MAPTEPIVSHSRRPRGERRRTPWALAVAAAVVLVVLVVVPFLLLRPRTAVYVLQSYETALVKQGTLVEYVRGAGVLVPRSERTLLAPGAGVLVSWDAAEGDDVAAGSLLGSLESTDLSREAEQGRADVAAAQRRQRQQRLDQQEAQRAAASNLARLETEAQQARAELEIASELYELGAIARVERDSAVAESHAADQARVNAEATEVGAATSRQLASEAAAADINAARAALVATENSLQGLEIRSPIGGRVISLRVAAGESVTNRQPLAVVAATDDLRVRANVSEAQARRVAVGQATTVRVSGTTYASQIAWVAPQAITVDGGQMVEIEAEFSDQPQRLRIGSSASVEVEVGRLDDALYLPRGPYLTTGGERLAYVAEGGVARRELVVFGLVDGDRVEVRDGLAAGQRVITSSYEAFKDRTTIELAPSGEIGAEGK